MQHGRLPENHLTYEERSNDISPVSFKVSTFVNDFVCIINGLRHIVEKSRHLIRRFEIKLIVEKRQTVVFLSPPFRRRENLWPYHRFVLPPC